MSVSRRAGGPAVHCTRVVGGVRGCDGVADDSVRGTGSGERRDAIWCWHGSFRLLAVLVDLALRSKGPVCTKGDSVQTGPLSCRPGVDDSNLGRSPDIMLGVECAQPMVKVTVLREPSCPVVGS